MKNINKFNILIVALTGVLTFTSCDDNDNNDNNEPTVDFSGTYVQQDQMARPAINTVFIAAGAPKDEFNSTIPSMMGTKYQMVFQDRLMALNAGYTTNALGMDAATFTGALATDVLNVSKTGKTTFFDGTNVLTGRALADDVIDVELLLIFGGPMGTSNPGLTSDHVDANDKAFLTAFPYLAGAW
ncbi:DUF4331 domain-containing protein [Flavobacterium sp. GA093]|uniref:DUF4331 domain-containing protein n=1 Tax=Flavobacterium hydrocarbonoxydans TaxID=2683249 RepID=A0A6I4NQ65_9FLAO|nr:DUF4331 family protein [Flavobacterium hydrocarbonoxydans]MWB96323.1 DUF4331 domain-containing protein [Flavobacterium hydrocarbonoxydans]